MNNKIKTLLIVLAMAPSFVATAQNIGYQGRKTTFYYNAFVSPRSFTNSVESIDDQTLNLGHSFEFDFNYSASNSLGVAYRTMNSRQMNVGQMAFGNANFIFSPEVMPTFSPTSIGLFIKFRRFDKLAPLGRHQKLALYYNQVTVDYNPDDVMNTANYSTTNGTKPAFATDPWGGLNGKTYSNIAIGYSIGNQRIISNRYLFTYGVEYVYTVTESFSEYSSGFVQDEADDHFGQIAYSEVNNSSLLNFHIGFGILGPRKKSRY